MTERRRLPNRRAHELINFRHNGFAYVAGIGRFSDGRLAEIFLNVCKSGTELESAARDSAVLVSFCLQHDVTVQTIRHAITRNGDGTASGPIGKLLDLLAASSYGGSESAPPEKPAPPERNHSGTVLSVPPVPAAAILEGEAP